ncbi:MAG TPA: hypothetical protein VN626_02030 [Clostridia bacterium]|nr:hypothetical protein [Clostridia bacterium]
MKKLSNLIALFALFAAMIGLIIAAVSFFDRKRKLVGDDEYEDELYGGQEYYSEDLSFDAQPTAEAAKTAKEE